jgi:CHASE3 domain sensor protein
MRWAAAGLVAELGRARAWVRHTYEVIDNLNRLGLATRDVERSQRGFLRTRRDIYLIPFQGGLDQAASLLQTLTASTADNPSQQARLHGLRSLIDQKILELRQTISLARQDGLPAALKVVNSDQGYRIMVDIENTLL